MTTPRTIIEEAFGYTTVKAEEEPLTAAMMERGRLILNDLLEEYNTAGMLDLDGVATGSIDEDLNEPRYATRFLKTSTAIDLCSFYRVPTLPEFKESHKRAKSAFYAGAVNNQAADFPSTLPRGSGNYDETERAFFNELGTRNF